MRSFPFITWSCCLAAWICGGCDCRSTLVTTCGPSGCADASGSDAGNDASLEDAGEMPDAAEADAGADSGVVPTGDAGADAGSAAGVDASLDDGGCGWGSGVQTPFQGANGGLGGGVVLMPPRLSWNAGQLAALWDETVPPTDGGTTEVQFAFVDPLGTPVGGTTQIVSPNDGVPSSESAWASNGNGFGLVYVDAVPNLHELFFELLGPTGSPIGSPVAVRPAPTTADQQFPAIAWNPVSSEWGVTWTEGSVPDTLYFARISSAGAVLNVAPFLTTGNTYCCRVARAGDGPLVWNGANYALTWRDQNNLWVQEISPGGVPVVASKTLVSPGATVDPEFPTLATNGTLYLVVWTDYRSNSLPFSVRYALANVGGGFVAGSDNLLAMDANQYSDRAGVTWDGQQFVAVWEETSVQSPFFYDIRTAKFSSAGVLQSKSTLFPLPAPGAWPLVTGIGCTHAVSWLHQDMTGRGQTVIGFVP